PEGQKNDKKALDEYMDLFINFKLKVIEAEALKLDTNPSFVRELQGYRKQLAAPYLVDKDVDDQLLKETYDRMCWDVRASHILINVDESSTDTAAAYKLISDLRKKALSGESFDTLAYKFSQDPSAKTNYGDLGYFTVFQMVYPFESAAFNTPKGQVSEIVRTKFGYHIIKVVDKRKSKGEVKVAHIMIALPKDANADQQKQAELKIRDIYEKIKNGADFAKTAEEVSDDKTSAKKGGELNWFGTGRMVPEFEAASFALAKTGDISQPIKTAFGWHIIKKVDEKPIGTYDELKTTLKNRVAKDARNQKSKTALIEKLKVDYKYISYPKNILEVQKTIDTTIFVKDVDDALKNKYSKPIFTVGDTTFLQYDLIVQLKSMQKRDKSELNKANIESAFKALSEKEILNYEEKRLDQKYPDFRYLMQEYHDGILLFDLTDKMVWSKAVKDTVGIESFYEQHKNNYMWGKRVDVSYWNCENAKCKASAIKYLTKNLPKGFDEKAFLAVLNKKEANCVSKASQKLYSEGDDKSLDKDVWQNKTLIEGKLPSFVDVSEKQIIIIHSLVNPEPKKLSEAKGLITADYQTYLEKEWIQELRNKYNVKVNQDVFQTIKP
ncbi:MAG: hypothetical protein CVU05_13245, partial [Bacteroidetes bacterium HGW-Bacteroidetes-21]